VVAGRLASIICRRLRLPSWFRHLAVTLALDGRSAIPLKYSYNLTPPWLSAGFYLLRPIGHSHSEPSVGGRWLSPGMPSPGLSFYYCAAFGSGWSLKPAPSRTAARMLDRRADPSSFGHSADVCFCEPNGLRFLPTRPAPPAGLFAGRILDVCVARLH